MKENHFLVFIVTTSSFSIYSISSLKGIYRRRLKGKGYSSLASNFPQEQKISNQTLTIDFSNYDGHENGTCSHDDIENYIHQSLMDVALDQAREAGKLGEVPIGAIIVKEIQNEEGNHDKKDSQQDRQFILLSKGQNEIEKIHDASAHAELQALRSASRNIQNWRLINTTLYTTLEPCPMCLSAAQAFRVSKIVYGAPDLRLGAIETHIQLLDVAKHPFHDTMEVEGGIKREECSTLLKDFFRERRKRNKKKAKMIEPSPNKLDGANNNKGEENNSIERNGSKNQSFVRRLLHKVRLL